MAIISNFDSFGLYSHISALINTNFTRLSWQCVERPIFGALSKRNTDIAALCAGLPVKSNKYLCYRKEAPRCFVTVSS